MSETYRPQLHRTEEVSGDFDPERTYLSGNTIYLSSSHLEGLFNFPSFLRAVQRQTNTLMGAESTPILTELVQKNGAREIILNAPMPAFLNALAEQDNIHLVTAVITSIGQQAGNDIDRASRWIERYPDREGVVEMAVQTRARYDQFRRHFLPVQLPALTLENAADISRLANAANILSDHVNTLGAQLTAYFAPKTD